MLRRWRRRSSRGVSPFLNRSCLDRYGNGRWWKARCFQRRGSRRFSARKGSKDRLVISWDLQDCWKGILLRPSHSENIPVDVLLYQDYLIVAVCFGDPEDGSSPGKLSFCSMHCHGFIVDASEVRHHVYFGCLSNIWSILPILSFKEEPVRLLFHGVIKNA